MDAHDYGPEMGAEWRGQLRTMQIIAGAFVAGPATYAAITVLSFEGANDSLGRMGMMALGFAAVMIVVSFIVPGTIGKVSEGGSPTALMAVCQTRLIVKLALLEGAAFFNIIALHMEHNWWSLAAAILLMILMLASFPTRSKIVFWVQTQKEMSSLD